MKIMAINAGSSSLKFSLFEMNTKECIASGYFERVGLDGSFYTIKYNGAISISFNKFDYVCNSIKDRYTYYNFIFSILAVN